MYDEDKINEAVSLLLEREKGWVDTWDEVDEVSRRVYQHPACRPSLEIEVRPSSGRIWMYVTSGLDRR